MHKMIKPSKRGLLTLFSRKACFLSKYLHYSAHIPIPREVDGSDGTLLPNQTSSIIALSKNTINAKPTYNMIQQSLRVIAGSSFMHSPSYILCGSPAHTVTLAHLTCLTF